jgi:hypothetical protein
MASCRPPGSATIDTSVCIVKLRPSNLRTATRGRRQMEQREHVRARTAIHEMVVEERTPALPENDPLLAVHDDRRMLAVAIRLDAPLPEHELPLDLFACLRIVEAADLALFLRNRFEPGDAALDERFGFFATRIRRIEPSPRRSAG